MDEHPIHTVAIHVDDFKTVPSAREDVTGARNTPEDRDRKTAKCVVLLTLRIREQVLGLEQVLHCVDLESTIHEPTAVFPLDDRWLITRCDGRSPTMEATTSVMLTSPSTPPNSSTTNATGRCV